MLISGTVASNHGNLYTTLIALVLRALQSTHSEVNGTEEGKGEIETGTETGTERAGQQGRNKEGNGKRKGGRERGAKRGQGRKTEPVGQGCANIQDSLRVGRCRLDSAPTTSVTDVTVDWRRHCGGCHRPTWTWAYSRKHN